jgi:hypothetical protein
MGDRTDKVSTLRLKAARTPADTEPAKPPRRGPPVAQAPPVRAPPPKQRGRPRQVTFSLPPTTPPTTTSAPSASGRPLRTARPPNHSTSEPAAAEFGGDLWWRTICSYCVSRLDRHVTYYTSPHVYTCDTRLSLPSLKYTVVAWLLTCLHLSTKQLLFANNRNRVRWVVLCLSQDGACTDLFENFSENSLKGDLSNNTTLNPPLFSFSLMTMPSYDCRTENIE